MTQSNAHPGEAASVADVAARLRELLAKAPEGPWSVQAYYTAPGTPDETTRGMIVNKHDYGIGVIDEDVSDDTESLSPVLDLIVEAVNALPILLAALEKPLPADALDGGSAACAAEARSAMAPLPDPSVMRACADIAVQSITNCDTRHVAHAVAQIAARHGFLEGWNDRDRDGSPKGEDADAASFTTARAEGIAVTSGAAPQDAAQGEGGDGHRGL